MLNKIFQKKYKDRNIGLYNETIIINVQNSILMKDNNVIYDPIVFLIMFNEYGTDIPEHLSFRTNNSDSLKINESELSQLGFLTLNISYKFKTQTVYRP